MRRFVKLKIAALLFATTLLGCERLKPESVSIANYPDLEALLAEQIHILEGKSLEKEVWLDGKIELKKFELDTSFLRKELSFLIEINPNTPQYVGAFEVLKDTEATQMTLMSGEKGELKTISYSLKDDGYSSIKAVIHEDKEIYSHHRDFDIYFENGMLKNYMISGYQKILFKDTIEFKIIGKVN